MIGNSDDETNFPHKLLLPNRQVPNICKVFANDTSTDIRLSKAQLTKMQKGGFLRFIALLLKSGLPLLKSVIKPLGILGLAAAASATDAAINKKILGSGNHTTLIISNDDMQDLLKIVKSLENRGILLDGITETVKNSRTQAYDSVMCGYFCIGFINYMFMVKSLTDYTNIFSPNNFKKNDDIILNYLLNKL